MRLNKLVALKTKLSRRQADKAVLAGEISINHKIITNPALSFELEDKMYYKGKLIKNPSDNLTVIVYHKPKGELVTSSDPRQRKIIYDTLPKKFSRFKPVGRLDFASCGLLLLSDSTQVVSHLMKSDLARIYKIKLQGNINEAIRQAMQEGLVKGLSLENSTAGAHHKTTLQNLELKPFLDYQILTNKRNFSKLKLSLSEGKNREIRRFFAHFERQVLDLKRLSFGPFELNALPEGKFRFLTGKEYKILREMLKA